MALGWLIFIVVFTYELYLFANTDHDETQPRPKETAQMAGFPVEKEGGIGYDPTHVAADISGKPNTRGRHGDNSSGQTGVLVFIASAQCGRAIMPSTIPSGPIF
jgi:hypothetical protein